MHDVPRDEQEELHELNPDHIQAHLVMNNVALADPYAAAMNTFRAALAFGLNHPHSMTEHRYENLIALRFLLHQHDILSAPVKDDQGVYH